MKYSNVFGTRHIHIKIFEIRVQIRIIKVHFLFSVSIKNIKLGICELFVVDKNYTNSD